ncbi:MAG: DUF2817 domain-containing protein [Proteobacteria bacterium]|nr:DUF2817 domain-containing protein [Pseudomonadota bacterium]
MFLRVIAIIGGISLVSCGQNLKKSRLSSAFTQADQVYVRVPKSLLTQEWVSTNQFNRDHAKDNQYAIGWLPVGIFDSLPQSELKQITTLDEFEVATGQLNPFTLESQKSFELPSDIRAGYTNYVALTDEMKRLANTFPDISRLESVGKSIQGRELWMMKVSTSFDQNIYKPKLIYIANMHGDEVIGRELSLNHLRRLLETFGSDQRITDLVNNSDLFIIPTMNPDGFELKQRYNAKNKDLNRSFPDFTSDPTDSTAGRPIETAAIMDLHSKHHFTSAINFHGGEVCFNLPWDTKANQRQEERFGDDQVLNKMGRGYSDSNPTMVANNSFDRGLTYGYEWYEVNGGMQDWSIYYRKSMHATVELSYTKWPTAAQIPVAWEENKESMLKFMEQSIQGIAVEAVSEDGSKIENFTFGIQSSSRSLSFSGAFGFRPTLSGNHKITVSSPGFESAVVDNVPAKSFDGTFNHIVLKKQ